MPSWIVIALACVVGLYVVLLALLFIGGHGTHARAFARFVPDCVVLFRRLLRDPRLPRGKKLLLWALVGYLALPFDLVPDFIPVIGHLDDALLVALTLRIVLRSAGDDLIRAHWPGPEPSLRALLRLAGAR